MGKNFLKTPFFHHPSFNRNWCSISLRELVYATGMGENTVRRSLAPLINDSWVAIASDGYREATTYVLRIPVDDAEEKEEAEEEDGEAETPFWRLQNGVSRMAAMYWQY